MNLHAAAGLGRRLSVWVGRVLVHLDLVDVTSGEPAGIWNCGVHNGSGAVGMANRTALETFDPAGRSKSPIRDCPVCLLSSASLNLLWEMDTLDGDAEV